MRYMTIKMRRELSLVLLPVDDFTDKVIVGSGIRMYTLEGRRPSIRKEDGYHVFCDLQGDAVQICVEGPLYQRQVLTLLLASEPEVIQVRMIPGDSYPIPAGSTCIRGTLGPGSRIRLYFPEQKRCCKLLYDYDVRKNGKELSLFQPETARLEGKTLCIRDKEAHVEFFRIKEQQGEQCRMEAPLSRNYKKIGTTVYRVYEAYAKSDGSIYLPIQNLPEGDGICMLQKGGTEEEDSFCMKLIAGKENRITGVPKKEEEEG